MASQNTGLNKRKRHQSGRYKKSRQQWLAQKVRVIPILAIFSVLILAVFGMHLNANESGSAYRLTKHKPDSSSASGRSVALVVYSDLQCPACAYYHEIIKKLERRFGNVLVIEYRHFPLWQIHDNAEMAARCVVAASSQNKAAEMRDLLYANQSQWAHKSKNDLERLFVEYAMSIGLSPVRFSQDIVSVTVAEKVHGDYTQGTQRGVSSTPTFLFNGIMLESNPLSYSDFEELLASLVETTKHEEKNRDEK